MINRIKIINFRAHQKLTLKFGPGVNSIIGDNAAGKSTIIRAIRYVAMNKPSGESVISWNAKKAKIVLTFNDHKIIRTRSKSINTYKLNKDKLYKAFGNKVPDEIQKVLNLSEINFQGQHEAPFWFCKTAGEVSRELNAIVNLDTIDKTLSNILSSINKSKITINVISDRLNEAKEKKQNLVYIKDMNIDLLRIELLEKAKTENRVGSSLLDEILRLAKIYAIEHKSCLKRVSDADLVLDIALGRLKISENIESLAKLLKSAKKLKRIIKSRPPSFVAIQNLYMRLKKILVEIKEFSMLIKSAKEKTSEIQPLKQQVKNCTKKINKIMKGSCPLCGRKL